MLVKSYRKSFSSSPALFHRQSLRHSQFVRNFNVLALESSADDTCAAVVNSDRRILSNVVRRQDHLHEPLGGIHPAVAISGHQQNMPIVVRDALLDAGITMNEVDGVAFTRGPGMGGCLSVAVNAAKTLACALGKPIIAVHHMQAHALTVFLTSPESDLPSFPFIAYLLSGGHTLIVLVKSHKEFRTLATTTDEAVGRTIDKVARALQLPWSVGRGLGASLEQFCIDGDNSPSDLELPKFPVPFPGQLSFSFSGLHSAALHFIEQKEGGLGDTEKLAFARAFQTAIARQLEDKLVLALQQCLAKSIQVRHVVVSGGVASNQFLRDRFRTSLETNFPNDFLRAIFPPISLCTDNAAMIAWAAMYRFLANECDDFSIEPKSKWNIEESI